MIAPLDIYLCMYLCVHLSLLTTYSKIIQLKPVKNFRGQIAPYRMIHLKNKGIFLNNKFLLNILTSIQLGMIAF